MKIIPIIFCLSFFLVQKTPLQRWICTDYKVEVRGQVHHPIITLKLFVSGRMVSGTLKIIENSKVIRISELIGSTFADGSASLSERWVEQSDLGWLPNFNSFLITNLKDKSFKLNFNSASTGKSKDEKGHMIFQRMPIKPMT